MSPRVFVEPVKLEAFLRGLAREDLQSAAAGYQQRRDGLGYEFISEFLSCIVENDPELYPVVDADVRRLGGAPPKERRS